MRAEKATEPIEERASRLARKSLSVDEELAVERSETQNGKEDAPQ